MIVLDTDTLTLVQRDDSPSRQKILDHLANTGPNDLATTIITYEEQTRGWFKYMGRAKNISQEIDAYSRLKKHVDNYRSLIVVNFDALAADEFQRLRKMKVRIGTKDLKIASIVKAQDATLFTGKIVDFKKVPGLKIMHWTS